MENIVFPSNYTRRTRKEVNKFMHQKPILSIVIPFYNCATYVERCLRSFNGINGIEIIAVDDGSKDETLSILRVFERKMDTLKVIHKCNEGVSSARNVGIQHCTGEYLTFVDGDDVVNPEALKSVIEWLKKANKNLYILPVYRGDEQNRFFKDSYYERLRNAKKPCEELYKMVIQGRSNELFSKIFMTDIILSKNLKLDQRMFMGEDAMFFIDYLIALDELDLGYTDTAYYYYYRNNSSVTSNIRNGFPSQEQLRYRHVKKLIHDKYLSKEYSIANDSFYLHKLIYFVSQMKNNGVSKSEIFSEIMEKGIYQDISESMVVSIGDKFRKRLFMSKNVDAMRFFVSCITLYHSLTERRSRMGEEK